MTRVSRGVTEKQGIEKYLKEQKGIMEEEKMYSEWLYKRLSEDCSMPIAIEKKEKVTFEDCGFSASTQVFVCME